MTELTMPRLSDSMTDGIVMRWLVADGDLVSVGDDVAEIETDKAVVALASEHAGTIRPLLPEGDRCPVGTVIATIGADPAPAPPDPVAPEREDPVHLPHPVVGWDLVAPATRSQPTSGREPAATPLATRVAAQHGITLAGVAGTGPRGRITRGDVLRAAGVAPEPPPTPASARPSTPPAPALDGDARGAVTRRPLSRLQQVVARRMAEATATIPHFQVQVDAAIDDLLALRASLRAEDPATAPTINDLLLKACAGALRNDPLANSSFTDEAVEVHERVNVGFAVSDGDALVVPTIFDADTLGLGAIARETRRLAEAVRAGTITPAELSGGTFTVSNLGMFGPTAIVPVINPPQAAILGVGAARRVLDLDADGEVVARSVLTLTLSCDHRILYGADAARLLTAIRDRIEHPLRLAL